MGMGEWLEGSGYVWMVDKIDWAAMVFYLSCCCDMVFNMPSVQSTYHGQYWEVKVAKVEFLLFHNITLHLQEHQVDVDQSVLLLQLLCDLSLCVFHQKVFWHLALCKMIQPLHSCQIDEAWLGHVPLTTTGV